LLDLEQSLLEFEEHSCALRYMNQEFHNPQLDHLYFEINKGTNSPLRSISMGIATHDEGFEPTPKTRTKMYYLMM
jgi:hypothetical protein